MLFTKTPENIFSYDRTYIQTTQTLKRVFNLFSYSEETKDTFLATVTEEMNLNASRYLATFELHNCNQSFQVCF